MAEPPRDERRPAWERWLPLAGIGAVALWVTGLVLDPGIPDLFEAGGEEWLRFVEAEETGIVVSRTALLAGHFLLFVFLAALRVRLAAADPEPRRWTATAFAGGIGAAVLLVMSTTPVVAAAAAAEGLEPSAAQALGVVEYAFFIGAQVAAAVLLFATGMLALRTAALPAWLGWASFVVAALLLFGVGAVGFVAIVAGFPLWVLTVSILLLRRDARARGAASPET